MNSLLRDIARDLCESCTPPVSIFKQSFERAGHGEQRATVSAPAPTLGMQPAP